MKEFGSMRIWRLAMMMVAGMVHTSPVAALNTDLMVCLAYDNRPDQLKCCEELGIDSESCNRSASSDIKEQRPNAKDRRNVVDEASDNEFFYCKYQNLDGTGVDWSRWGKGTDFKYMPEKKVWEWRTKYAVQTINENGAYYQRALVPYFSDQMGRCDKNAEKEYKQKLEEIKKRYGQ